MVNKKIFYILTVYIILLSIADIMGSCLWTVNFKENWQYAFSYEATQDAPMATAILPFLPDQNHKAGLIALLINFITTPFLILGSYLLVIKKFRSAKSIVIGSCIIKSIIFLLFVISVATVRCLHLGCGYDTHMKTQLILFTLIFSIMYVLPIFFLPHPKLKDLYGWK